MKIRAIFFYLFIGLIYCQDDPTEVLSITVDGLLMKEASITASSTCGINGPEKYCRLVDEGQIMTDYDSGGNVMCDICDDRNETKRHPIEYAKSDDKNLWWQSPSMAQGSDYQRVNITIDLKQVYQIVYILLKMADSPRPGTWVLERSIDGDTYHPWIFFADTPYACYNKFQRRYSNIQLTSKAMPDHLGDDEVFCTTYYSQTMSFNAGEIIISLINGRDSLRIQDNLAPRSISLQLINFLSARYIRFRFLKPLTLAADLMTHRDHLEKSIYNRYYYSLRNIEIGGKCICNNHADKCDKVIKNGISVAQCNCKHNTCGNNCEKCCDLFNQKPWRQGQICEECNCNRKASKCHYNQTVATLQLSFSKLDQIDGGGVCEDCRENTAGINCDKCRKGYYRPWNVRATESFPCKPCACSGVGTDGSCISNGEEVDNQRPGDCVCKVGYKGTNCDRCDNGFQHNRNLECVPCPCSIEGSVASSLYSCMPPCNCKVNVEVESNCHKCKQHFFNLDRSSEEGCQPCYCFGVTDNCSSLSAQNVKVHNLENWKVTTLDMNREVDARTSSLQYPTVENTVADTILENPSVYYWSAPKVYLGNWLTSYKSLLQYVIKIEKIPGISGSQIDSPDVIIKCGSDQIFHSISSEDTRKQMKVLIPLQLKYWKFLNPDSLGSQPSKDEFMSCLVDVRALLIKGKYYSNQNSIGLLNVTLDRGDALTSLATMPHVEKCECPPGFSGLSCESCGIGYRRVKNILVNGKCEKCACYKHSDFCDPISGNCKNCLHNTTGAHCDTCSPGYYGNPRIEDPTACKRCSCPLEDYQLATTCSTFEPNKYVCYECTERTGGPHCQRCIEGYFGNPLKKIPCRKCQCNDNEESCDSKTGQCRCTFNTMGSSCELCKHSFYGEALNKNCQNCNCSMIGSKSQFCDKSSGRCPCKTNFSGRTCETCVEGLYLKNQKCVPCECNNLGSILSKQSCDPNSGRCLCREGVTGSPCDRCLPDYYGFPNCRKCECSNHSLSTDCDSVDGTCKCGQNVEDFKCKNCQYSFYWSNRTECSQCRCGLGSTQSFCDMNSGQCPCAPHVVGRSCDQCDFDYFGLSSTGCRKCPKCFNGRVCNNDGNCVCPLNTEGDHCQNCVDKSWGYNKTKGCKKCDCAKQGSMSETCDSASGQCICDVGFQGKKCDECGDDHFGFPKCQPCNCNRDGVLRKEQRSCDTTTGRCPCKQNVEGLKCDECKNGTFGLNGKYIAGCYSCFCSGRSSRCSVQSEYRLISNGENKYHIFNDAKSYVSGKDQRVLEVSLQTLPRFGWPTSFYRPVLIDVTKLLNVPDLSLVYRSVLLTADIVCPSLNCGRENTIQTEAIIESNGGLMELSYVVNHTRSNSTKIVVELSETSSHGQWYLTKYDNISLREPTNLGSQKLIDLVRDAFIMALLNVSKVKIQLYASTVNPDEIKLNIETFHPFRSKENVGIPISSTEKCECDNTTVGAHCESPIDGYYKKMILPEVFFNISFRIGKRIIGNVEKCFCNGHSTKCHKGTGYCIDCMNNTTGEKCNLCGEGFFGDPRNNKQCFTCECPSKQHNYAKKCVKLTSEVFRCDCLEGHSGKLCTECSKEFFGNPIKGIRCKRCDCNPDGSLSSNCDNSGKCECAAGVLGDKCDQCAVDYVVEDKKCKHCLTGCTKDLFMRIRKLNDSVSSLKWKSLPSKGEAMLKKTHLSLLRIKGNLTDFNRFVSLNQEIESMIKEFKRKSERLTTQLIDANNVKRAYEATIDKISEKLKYIEDTIRDKKDQPVTQKMIIDATDTLKEINEWKLKIPDFTSVQQELSMVQIHIAKLSAISKEIKNKKYLEQIANITDLVTKTKLALMTNVDNKEYLNKLSKMLSNNELKMKQYNKQIEEIKKEYSGFVLRTIYIGDKLSRLKNKTSDFNDTFNIISKNYLTIKALLDKLSNQADPSKAFVISDDIKDLVQKNVEKAKDLTKNLLKSFHTLSNAEEARNAYIKIITDIDDVEKAMNLSSEQLKDSKLQLNIDIFSINTDGIIKNNTEIMEIKRMKEKKFESLFNEYNERKDKQGLIENKNNDILSKMRYQTFEVNSFNRNISIIKALQKNNMNTIKFLTKQLESFEFPKSSVVNLTDIKTQVDDLKKDYSGITNETVSMIVSIKTLREGLKKIREKLQKRKVHSELAHGAAAKAPEPIRLDKNCVRHYKTYFLPKSSAFSLEIYLNPQFINQQNLVIFGFDNSGGFNVSFALTIEEDKNFKFWYETGRGSGQIVVGSPILSPKKYIGLIVSWELGKWTMQHKVMEEDKEQQFGTYEGNATNFNNIFLGPNSHIFLGGFPSDELLKRSGISLGGKLIENLKENYKTKYYKGCIYGVSVMQFELGLQDLHNVEEQCGETKGSDFLLGRSFNCKISQSNTAFIEKSKNSVRRVKREKNTEHNIHFNGLGYMMINTSHLTEKISCSKNLKKVINIYTFPQSKIHQDSFQFVLAFLNEKSNFGIVLGQKSGRFQRAYWNGDQEFSMTDTGVPNDLMVWKTFDKNNNLIFGTSELCDPNSFMYVGGIPLSDTKLRERLLKLQIPYISYTGSMRIAVVDSDLFIKKSTRFVNTVKKSEKLISILPFHSILVPTDPSEKILINHDKYKDVLKKGFSINVNFMGKPVTEQLTLITIASAQTTLSLTVSKDCEFTVSLNDNNISMKGEEPTCRWQTYYVIVTLELKNHRTEMYLLANKPTMAMKDFPVRIDTNVTRIEIGQPSIRQPFYIYDIFLGGQFVNFNERPIITLPVNSYLKLSQSQLSPIGTSFRNSTKYFTNDLRVSSTNRDNLQSDGAATPYTSNGRTYTGYITASHYSLPYSQSEDYPLDSAWFMGQADSMMSVSSALINKYVKQSGNAISVRINSPSERPEMILSINFGPSRTLNIISVDKEMMLYDSLTRWNSTLRVPIINKEWHLIEIRASSSSDTGLLVRIDEHSFDFPHGPFSFTRPNLIEIGGYSGARPTIFHGGQKQDVEMFTGCLDNFKINNNKVILKSGPTGTPLKQCPRVLEFFDNSIEIKSSYTLVNTPREIVKINIEYNAWRGISNFLTIEFKFKFTGFESGGLLVTGDGSRFCALVVNARKLFLNCMTLGRVTRDSVNLDNLSDGWNTVTLSIFHVQKIMTQIKLDLNKKDTQLYNSGSDIFSDGFMRPDIYLGGHPLLNADTKYSLMSTNNNFVGCITELKVRVNEVPVKSVFGSSQHTVPDQCSVDKFTYLRKI